MKFFVCLAFALIAYAAATPAASSGSASSIGSSVSSSNAQEAESEVQQKPAQVPVAELTRLRKAAYGGGGSSGGYGGASVSIPAPPCPKNYLISCQPNLAPIPCASSSSSYGSAGAYSAPVPTYVRNNYGVPQNFIGASYVPQGFAYNNNNKQYYQY